MESFRTDATEPNQLIRDIAEYIDRAELLVEKREILSLTGLDEAVVILCQQVVALPAEQSTHYGKELDQLQERLVALQKKMQQALSEFKNEIEGLGVKRKAMKAYRPPEGT